MISFMYAAVIMPVGRAITAIPISADIIVIMRPMEVTGEISPYPMVVIEMIAQ